MVVIGFAIWLGATIALRVVGQFVFALPSLALLAITLPLMIGVALLVLPRHDRATAAIYLAAPGMLLDTVSTIVFPRVFPNIRPDAAGLFGGWLLFANVVVLLTAVSTGKVSVDGGAAVIEDPLQLAAHQRRRDQAP
jgi:hypothetical protein